jgi:hypothetical protein
VAGWNGQASRRRPFPYDAYISNTRVMLDPGQDGNLVGTKSKTLDQIAPTNYEYGSANPFLERTESWNELYGGMGELLQPEQRPRRYQYAQRADLSVDGYWMKGPNFENHVETITGAGEIRQFVKALHNGIETIFAVCQNGVWVRLGDGNWGVSLTSTTSVPLSVSINPQQGARFKGAGGVTGDYLWLGVSAGNFWVYNGTLWAAGTSGQGPLNPINASDPQVRYIERVGNELWVAGDYWVAKVEEDPLDRTKWAGAIYIGDQTSKITYLKALNNVLYIFKTDGIYTISTAGVDQELFPTLRNKISPLNGRNAAVWMNRMWFSFQDDVYTIDTNGMIEPDGLERMLENVSEVRGRLVASAGHNTWFNYELYYNSYTGKSYLVKHGTWIENPDQQGSIHFTDSHHGSLAEWSKQATCMQVMPNLGLNGNDRLYVGFADGTLEWCVLPLSSPNPANDVACEYTAQDSYVYLPIHHANFQADNKFWRGISIPGPHITATEYAVIEYKHDLINPSGTWLTLHPEDPNFTLPAMRHNWPTVNPIYSRSILIRVKLVRDVAHGSPVNQTPVLQGINIHEAIRPEVSLEYLFSIKAGSYLPRHNGTVDRRRGSLIRDEILAAASQVGAVLVRLTDGTTQEMVIIDYKESTIPKQKRRDIGFLIQLTCLQIKAFTNIAVESGITYGTLERYTLGQLENLL